MFMFDIYFILVNDLIPFQLLSTFILFSVCLAAPSPDADAAPAAYASDYTQYFLAPEPAPAPAPSSQYHSQDDAGRCLL